MSLWRVKHTLSPVVEAALIAVVASYGILAIYLSSMRPLVVATLSPVVSLPQPVSLDTDAWSRFDDPAYGYAFALPPAWTADASDPSSVRIGRSAKERAEAPDAGEGILIQSVALGPRQQIENIAVADFADERPALYDVSVDGRPALFSVAFENARVVRQAVYVQDGARAVVIRAATIDPAVFATFVSAVKFYATETPKTLP